MNSPFHDLRKRFESIFPTPEEHTTHRLREWIDEHLDHLIGIKPDAEFNDTMMQGFD